MLLDSALVQKPGLLRMELLPLVAFSIVTVGALAVVGAARLGATSEAPRPVRFEVTCTVTDHEGHPLAGEAVRLILLAAPERNLPTEGAVFRTDQAGRWNGTISGEIRTGSRKRPTNFADSLTARREKTDVLQLGAELTYLGQRWLYVFPVHRFRTDGTVLLGDFRIFAPGQRGDFAQEVGRDGRGGWRFPFLGGAVLGDPGYRLTEFSFHPNSMDQSENTWVLRCHLQRSPEPARR